MTQSLIDKLEALPSAQAGGSGVMINREAAIEIVQQHTEAQVDESMRDLRSPISDIMLRWERGVNLYETTTEILQIIRPYLRSQPQAQMNGSVYKKFFDEMCTKHVMGECRHTGCLICYGINCEKEKQQILGPAKARVSEDKIITGEHILALHKRWMEAGCPQSIAFNEMEQ